jgi:hypothetical protein
LEVLNHLGRGLYRSFATVVAEAISNAWDAEATEVKITITDGVLIVEDNGKGMDSYDFQKRFLKVGYSRREDKDNKSKRSVIGRKGIGKLAMLSISQKVTILSKKKENKIIGGIINNTKLDKEIKKDGSYNLEDLSQENLKLFPIKKSSGTKIIFEKMKTKLNSEAIIRKYLATQFNFVFSLKKNDKFIIKVNNKRISQKDLQELHDKTQFIWFLETENTERKKLYKYLANSKIIENTSFNFKQENITVKGFIASVKHPRNLLLSGSGGDYKAGINLFCNGRLRQENLFEEITNKQIVEEYLYGEVHVDGFEDDENDRFTSSREGIIKDDPLYHKFLDELKKIQYIISKDWTPWRNKENDEGDIDVDNRPPYEVRMNDSRNRRMKDFQKEINKNVVEKNTKKSLQEKLRALSYKNTMVYQDLFILENIFREYIRIKGIDEAQLDANGCEEEKDIINTLNEVRNFRKQDEERHALKGKITKMEHYLNYLHLFHLGEIIDLKIQKNHKKPKKYRKGLEQDTKEIGPVRNSIMHTNEITEEVMKWDKIKNVINYVERLSNKTNK